MIPNNTNLFFGLKIKKIIFEIDNKGLNEINTTIGFKQKCYPLLIYIQQSFAFSLKLAGRMTDALLFLRKLKTNNHEIARTHHRTAREGEDQS